MRKLPLAIAALLVVAGAASASAQSPDPNRARSLSAGCAACHGTNGVSVGEVESLAGKPRDDIVSKMQEFKSGARTVMQQLAKGYTESR